MSPPPLGPGGQQYRTTVHQRAYDPAARLQRARFPFSSVEYSRINVKIAWSMYAKFRLGVSLHMQTKSNASIHRLLMVPLFRAIWQVCEICGNFLLISSHGLFEHRRCLTKMLPQNPRFRRDITNNLYLHRSYITTMVVNRISRCLKYLVAEPL